MPTGSPLILGVSNTAADKTRLTHIGTRTEQALLVENATRGNGVHGVALTPMPPGGIGDLLNPVEAAVGVVGEGTVGGVYGESPDGRGVWGMSAVRDGVFGVSSDGAGVRGESEFNAGVVGLSKKNTGVRGYGKDVGVFGSASNVKGIGVFGESPDGIGVRGEGHADGLGVLGTSANASGVGGVSVNRPGVSGVGVDTSGVTAFSWLRAGVYCRGLLPGTAAIEAKAAGGGALIPWMPTYAGLFHGDVAVNGGFTVFSGAKSAAVPHPDGSHRRLYSMESPESWFEDFGRSRLVRGRARVKLDPVFAALVKLGDYHVFLSPEGDTAGLYVAARHRTGFEVRERHGNKSTATFSYRVVARRKDIEGRRLEKLDGPPRVSGRESEPDPIKDLFRASGVAAPKEPTTRAQAARFARSVERAFRARAGVDPGRPGPRRARQPRTRAR